MSAAADLKPCPFCGGQAVLAQRKARSGFIVFALCKGCGANSRAMACGREPSSYEWDTRECQKAVTAWNKRTE